MKRQFWIIAACVVVLTVAPLLFVRTPALGPDGKAQALFGGSDDAARDAITVIAPHYRPWFAPLMEPGPEIASMLFALQAAIGAGVIGYWLGASVTRQRERERQRREREAAGHAPEQPAHQERISAAAGPAGVARVD
ncbi:energy-coupling factor ABC transporter substrate-binding protein [Brachymonas sp.]|uniref:energy-coupling factor ABC transporter substrate-binding protein n=1 Tax=Brachymonas sp. TaxID=1936292 RepID=UPI0035B0611E